MPREYVSTLFSRPPNFIFLSKNQRENNVLYNITLFAFMQYSKVAWKGVYAQIYFNWRVYTVKEE
jgi:hypothetical protein